jgi:hypothetical protein
MSWNLVDKIVSLLLLLGMVVSIDACQDTRSPAATSADIENWIEQLKSFPWEGPQNYMPLWVFNFTKPMRQILDVGAPAQDPLLRHLSDPAIKDQIIILLGGVGGVKSIEPIIGAMVYKKDDVNANPDAKKINLAANLALTNITAAEVIWHRGGGITIDKCPDDPKSCWANWWAKNKDHIEQEMNVSRLYANYPNYGIYQVR